MNNVQCILKEILAFGAKNTLDSIERTKNPILRFRDRVSFETAFKILKSGDFRFYNIDFPIAGNNNMDISL